MPTKRSESAIKKRASGKSTPKKKQKKTKRTAKSTTTPKKKRKASGYKDKTSKIRRLWPSRFQPKGKAGSRKAAKESYADSSDDR